jgi:hypothetical protein
MQPGCRERPWIDIPSQSLTQNDGEPQRVFLNDAQRVRCSPRLSPASPSIWTPLNGFGSGPAARVEPIRRYHASFPDLRMQIEDLIASGDTVALRSSCRGTDTGGYLGWEPTVRAVDFWVVTIMHFDGAKVVREWVGGRPARLVHPTRRGRGPMAEVGNHDRHTERRAAEPDAGPCRGRGTGASS